MAGIDRTGAGASMSPNNLYPTRLAKKMAVSQRIYLDNAATSWPKPESVYQAVEANMRKNGAPAGRGVFSQAADVNQLLRRTRRLIAQLINADGEDSIVFTCSGTDSLSTAIKGSLRPGDHVVTTAAEHNSVLRPLDYLVQKNGIRLTIVPCDHHGVVDRRQIVQSITSETRLLVMTHASNVTGAIQPVKQAFADSKQKNPNLITLLDAAQTLGQLPIDVADLQADILAAPGHKGLYGPLGTGVLYIDPRWVDAVDPLRLGGTGSSSIEIQQPTHSPEKFEAGNLNVPAIAGLEAGVKFLSSDQGDQAKSTSIACWQRLRESLPTIEGTQLFSPTTTDPRVGLLSFSLRGVDPHEAAASLDAIAAIQVRAGLHCAPLVHQAMGTAKIGGTIRISVGGFNTLEQMETVTQTINALSQMA